ncbi:MAG: MAPEG family protein, partial [Pseudomonadota bacterium]
MLPVTAMLAVTLAALFQALGILTIRRRRIAQVSVGYGGEDDLTRAVRAQGNLFEYGTVFTGLIALAEVNGTPWPLLAGMAAVFLIGRGCHAYGLLRAEPDDCR